MKILGGQEIDRYTIVESLDKNGKTYKVFDKQAKYVAFLNSNYTAKNSFIICFHCLK